VERKSVKPMQELQREKKNKKRRMKMIQVNLCLKVKEIKGYVPLKAS